MGAGHIITDTMYMAYVENMAAGDEAEKAVISTASEALAAVYDFIKIKFVPDKIWWIFLSFNEWESFINIIFFYLLFSKI